MKYFYDTEFLEGTQKKGWFGRATAPTIDLISIGIVAEDGREYYAVSKEFNLKEAWNRYDIKSYEGMKTNNGEPVQRKVYWIRDNVLWPIYKSLLQKERYAREHHYELVEPFSYKTLKNLIQWHGKSRKQIASDIIDFVMPKHDGAEKYDGSIAIVNNRWTKDIYWHPEFYGYYSAYDHVALCWLFGKMMNLPKGFPMYTRDLKQMLDETLDKKTGKVEFFNMVNSFGPTGADLSTMTLEQKLKLYKDQSGRYPAQENEHHALADARWNKKLYDFIQSIK